MAWLVRLALLRVVGRRIVPLLLLYDVFRLALAARRAWMNPRR